MLGGRIGIQWHLPYAGMSWRQWIYSTAHDSGSWFWRVLGWEINVPRNQ